MLKWALHCICCDGNPGNIKVNSDLIRCHCCRRQKVISWDNKSFKVKDRYDETYSAFGMASSIREIYPDWVRPQCRSILGGRNLVRVRNIVVVAIFDFMTYSGRLRRVEIVTLCEGERRKGLAPSPPLFGKFQHGAFASKLRAQRKRLHCRLTILTVRFILTSLHSELHISP